MRRILRLYRDAYTGVPAAVWWLAFVAFVNRAGSMVLPYLSLYLTGRLGLGIKEAGLVLTGWGLGSLVGGLFGGFLVDRVGARAVQAYSLLGAAIGFLLLGQVESFGWLCAVTFFAGLTSDAFRPANMVSVAAVSPPEAKSKSFAILRLALNLGWAIGPTAGGFLAKTSYALLFVIDAATCVLAVVVLLCIPALRGRRIESAGSPSPAAALVADRAPWRDRVFLVAVVLAMPMALVFMQIFGTLPLYFRSHYGLAEDGIGLLFAANAVLIIVAEMVIVHLLRNRPPLPLVAAGTLFTGLGFALMPLSQAYLFALFTVIVWTVGEMLQSPFMMTFISTRFTPRHQGAYMGLFTLAYSFAMLLAPLVGTAVFDHDPTVLWIGCGVVSALSALGFLALHRWTARAGEPTP